MKAFLLNSNFSKYLLLFLIVIVTNTCNQEKVKIGFMLPNLIKERYPKDRDIFTAKVNELGGQVIVADAQNDDKLQLKQAEELINQGIKVLVIIPVNKNTAAYIVRMAHKKNVKVVAYEKIIANCELDYYISYNNIKIGELFANYAFKKKQSGNFIVLGGDKGDQNAVWVDEGEKNILKPLTTSGKIKIIYHIYVEDWSSENAYYEVKTYLNLSLSIPDVILSSSDAMASGAIKALDEFGVLPDQYPLITGQNAELIACRNIVKGKQTMTIYKSLKSEAEEAAILSMNISKNIEINNINYKSFNGLINVPSILLEPIVVDANNLRNVIINSGFQKESDIYGN